MSARDILMCFKSSLDKMVGDLAGVLSTAIPGVTQVFYFDLDDSEGSRQMQAGSEHALVYQYVTLSPDPRHPLYTCEFLVGAKTSNDEGNYDMTTLLTEIGERFTEGDSIPLMDWSGEVDPTEQKGMLMVVAAAPSAQMFENQSGIRMFHFTGRVIAYD